MTKSNEHRTSIVVAIIGAIALIVAAIIGSQATIQSAKTPIHATETTEAINKLIQKGIEATHTQEALAIIRSTPTATDSPTPTPNIAATQQALDVYVAQSVKATVVANLDGTMQANNSIQEVETLTYASTVTSTLESRPTYTVMVPTQTPTSSATPEQMIANSSFRFYDKDTDKTTDIDAKSWKEEFNGSIHPGWHFLDDRWAVSKGALTLKSPGDELKSTTTAFLPILIGQDYEWSFDVEWEGRRGGITVFFGEIRSENYPYFKNTKYVNTPTWFSARFWDNTGGVCSFDVQLNKNFGDDADDLTSTRAEFGKCIFPGKHRFKFVVTGNRYLVEMDGEYVTEYLEIDSVDNNELKALFFQIQTNALDDSRLQELSFPRIDNIIVNLK